MKQESDDIPLSCFEVREIIVCLYFLKVFKG
jgi:hypothetical protein